MRHIEPTGRRGPLAALAALLEASWLGWELPPVERAFASLPIEADPPDRWCPRCGTSVGRGEVAGGRCGTCRRAPSAIARTIRLCGYGNEVASHILRAKHARWSAMAEELGRRLARQVDAVLTVEERAALAAVVPVPMPVVRRWFRGIDHTDLLAGEVGQRLGLPVVRALWQRGRGTQVGRSPTDRRRATGRFDRTRAAGRLPEGRSVLLVDDVRTTGATLEQAARVLRSVGAKGVIAAVVAVAQPPGRRAEEGRTASESG
jgi:predicted amidophosphoribosyltransferase